MDLQPFLSGNLVSLLPLQKNDFEELFQCASDPLIWVQCPDTKRYMPERFKRFFDLAIESQGAFAIRDKQSQALIGTTRFYNFKKDLKEVTIGYTFLGRRYWGGVYNGEVKALLLEYLFQTLDAVYFEIGQFNTRSRKAIERFPVAVVSETTLDGSPYVVYQMTKSSYLSWQKN